MNPTPNLLKRGGTEGAEEWNFRKELKVIATASENIVPASTEVK